MESLALLVGLILLTMISSGPVAIGLTFIRINNPVLKVLRRVLVCLLSAIGIGLGIMLVVENVALGAKLFSLFAISAASFALFREFKRR